VTSIIRADHPNARLLPELSDLLVTLYSTGDFLSPHDDANVGTWAFVISLMDGSGTSQKWEADFGGGLFFECPTETLLTNNDVQVIQWCEVLYPSFNTAVFFRSRSTPRGPLHQVSPVRWKAQEQGFKRFAITGWYMDAADRISESFKLDREKIRAREHT
jgi:Rps23 Pro-64 3,4-dihydroxylase Tpa1-like proline 4-hydroxylase